MFDLRYYQSDLCQAARREWENHQSTAIICVTGGGKTEMYMSLAIEEPGRVLVLVHRDYLITQPVERLARAGFDNVAVEKAEQRAEGGFRKAKIVFASVQSIGPAGQQKRLNTFNPSDFSLVIVDEAHRGVSQSYRRVLDHFKRNPRLKLLLLTATPNRKDGVALASVCDSVAGVYGPSQAMADGWIVPVKFYRRDVQSLDFSNVRLRGTDLDPEQVQDLLMQEKPLHEVCSSLAEDRGPTIVFCPEVAIARAYEELMNSRYRPGRAKMLYAESPDDERERAGKALAQGELDYIFNVNLYTEGYDLPSLLRVVWAAPTASLVRYCLSSDTEVLTDKGWVGLKDWDSLLDGRKAAGYDRETGKAIWTDILDRWRRPVNPGELMCCYESPHADFKVTTTHRLLMRPARSDKPYSLMPAEDVALRDGPSEVPVSAVQDAPGVPLADAELEFLGWMLTDGSVNRQNGQAIIRQAAHQPWIDDLEETLKRCGFRYSRREYTRTTSFKSRAETVEFTVSRGSPRSADDRRAGLTGWAHLEQYHHKGLSPLLESMTADQLAVFLHAVHLGDGAKQEGQTWKRGSYHICTGRREMADRLQSLCLRRGFRCNVAVETNGRKNPKYVLHIKRIQGFTIGGRTATDRNKIVLLPAVAGDEVWCVTTGTSTIVTRRNGKAMYMGQTQGVGRVFRTHPSLRGHLVGGPEEAEARRLLIEQSAKPFGIVVTYYPQNCKHELCDPVDILGGDDLRPDVKAAAKQVQEETSRLGGGSETEEDIETAKVFCDLRGLVDQRHRDLKAKASFADHEFDPMSGRKQAAGSVSSTGQRSAVDDATHSWGQGDPASEKQQKWLRWKGAPPGAAAACTKWRACVVRDLFEMGVNLITALGYSKRQALKIRDEMKARKGATT